MAERSQNRRWSGRIEAVRLLAAFAGVGLAADPVHGLRQGGGPREIEPNDMAPVAKRLTISLAGSTSSSGTGGRVHRRT
jgi:hypothetical protein